MSETQTQQQDVKRMEAQALSWPNRAASIQVVDQDTYDHAAELITDIVTLRKKVVDHYKPMKEAAHKAHREVCDAEKTVLAPLQEAETTVKRALADWDREQREKAEAERRRLEAAQRAADEEARLRLAEEAEANGASEEAVEDILETPVVVAAPIQTQPYRKAAGVVATERWSAEVVSIRDLCRAVADGKASPALVQANMTALNAMARAMKHTFRVPGCRAVATATMQVKAR